MTNQDQMFDDLAEHAADAGQGSGDGSEAGSICGTQARVPPRDRGAGKFQVSADIPEHMRSVCSSQVPFMMPSCGSRMPGARSLAI